MRASLVALAAMLLLGSVASLTFGTAPADPWTIDNGDGTSTAIWNFTTPVDYTRIDTEIAGGSASLARYVGNWNSTTAGEFAGPDNATNVDLVRWPGNVALASTSGPNAFLSLQPDPASGADAYLDQSAPATNRGADTTMVLDGFAPQSRPILRFNVSSIPANAVIDDATLNLYQSAGIGSTFTAYAIQVTSTWDEAQVTWNNRLSGTPWGTAGGDYNNHVIGQASLDNSAGWRAWNVTVLVDLWYRGRIPNQGLLLAAVSTGANADKTFFASDYAVNATRRPRLDIAYRVLGATGEYVSKVGGPGTSAMWQSISWNASVRSLVADEFDDGSLDPKWTWMNPPAAEDEGTTTPGHLHIVSDTGVDFAGGTFTGNLLWDQIVGDFNATWKVSTSPSAGGQKAGLMVLVDTWNWYGVQKMYDSGTGTVRWQVRATEQAATSTRVNVANPNPVPAWTRLVRTGNSFQAWTSDDGVTWTLHDTYSPAYEFPSAIRLGFFAADGSSGVPLAVDVDYIRIRHGTDAIVAVSTRTGNVTPVDGTWTTWSAAHPNPAGSGLSGSSRYIAFRLAFSVAGPDHSPLVGDVNFSWTARRLTGSIETRDLVTSDISEWGGLTVVEALNGQAIAYEYSLNGGGTWAAVSPPASLQAASVATGRIRFRATLTTTNPIVTPTLSEMRLTYVGARPSIGIAGPTPGAHVTGIVPIRYANSSGAVRVTFEYHDGASWTLIGSSVALNGTFLWNSSNLNFAAGSLRATVENNRTLTNVTVVSPIEVDNTPPTIALGIAIDDQTTSGTLTLAYTTDPDVVRVDLSFFNGTWNPIGSDTSVDGSFVWTPNGPVRNVTIRAVAIDEVGLRGSAERAGVGGVAGPNPPEWWQTPYVLAIPPIGIFVVVTMFAQRARWRPAKAFLVDDTNRLIREFTLDPSCNMTYDQVVGAGVLEAVEKPVKILKYHGQTVRGDALAVVLLAFGPVTPEHVEFAREMLVQIQAKFEDVVKERLKETRVREEEIGTLQNALDARRAEIEARAVEVTAMQQDLDTMRSGIAAEKETIGSLGEDLKRRESALEEERKALDNLAREVAATRANFDSMNEQIRNGQARLVEQQAALVALESQVRTAEAHLDERARQVVEDERRLSTERERFAVESDAAERRAKDLEAREAMLRKVVEELASARQGFETEQKDLLEFKRTVDTRIAQVERSEGDAAAKAEELRARETRLAPFEAELFAREASIKQAEGHAREEVASVVAAKAELDVRAADLASREEAFRENRVVLEEGRAAFESERGEFQNRTAHHEDELKRRQEEVEARARKLSDQQVRDARERELFERSRNEKNQAILAKEIEVEAREQSLLDREEGVRRQGEENARRLADLASREETLEVEAARVDKARAEVDQREGNLARVAKALDEKATGLREEEARRAEELRTWQTTLESQQALLKEQRETFEHDAAAARESWTDRVTLVERRELHVNELEDKTRTAVSWVNQNKEELTRREIAAQEAMQAATRLRAEVDRDQEELEQRSLEIASRERSIREEAAQHVLDLAKRTDAVKALEADLAAKREELERERIAQTERINQADVEVQRAAQRLDAKGRELMEREGRIAGIEEKLRSEAARLEHERTAVQETGKQLEAQQLELEQLRERYETESARMKTETDTALKSIAEKEAEIRSQQERIERDATALQDTLGAKAQDMALREKALAAREAELRSEEEDVAARIRELESRERQAEARTAEVSAQTSALVRREDDLNARAARFEETTQKFEADEQEKRRQWEALQATFRTQQAQFNANAETQSAENAKRIQELVDREQAFRSATTQWEFARSKLQAQEKAVAARASEAEAAWNRSERRQAELKEMETGLLRARQAFELERSSWSVKKAEELKQLEATRDAAAVQAQQAERLVAESQRRALVAEEAEKASKRQAADVATQLALLERRRSEAEKSEREAQGTVARLQEASQKLAVKESEVAAATRDLEVRMGRLVESEREATATTADLRSRKAAMDRESTRLENLAEQLTNRQKDLEGRTTILEAKLADTSQKERTLATELQRADNLMEDLSRKDQDIRARLDALRSHEAELGRREASLVARDAQSSEGLRNLEKARQDLEAQRSRAAEELRSASAARGEAEKLRVQAEGMQAEVSKNLRFLQKKAIDVLDKEDTFREREAAIEQRERALATKAEILEGKERAVDVDRSEFEANASRLQAEVERLRGRVADAERGAGPTAAAMEEWKKDIDNRVKIIQKKAMELLDREQKLRQKEEELRAMAQELGVTL